VHQAPPGILLTWDKSFNLGVLDLQLEVILPAPDGCFEGTYISSGWVFRYGNDEATEGI